jgi:hypothetical protein
MPTPKMDARDAWLASSTTGNARRRASGGLDYKKFDKIVDSDDEDESRKPQPPAQMLGMPPELKLALAKVEAAKERGDQAGTMLAMAELEARLQDQPADFKRMFLDGAGLPGRAGKKLSALDRKLAEIDDVAASIKALTSPVSQPSGSAANGTGGGGGGGSSSSSSSSSSSALDVAALDAANAKTKSMLAELQASKEKLAAQLAEVEKHKAAAAEAAAAVAQRNKDLQEAQEKKQKQGEIVDNTVHVARKAMVEQAKIYQEEDKLRAEMFLSLKVAVLSAGLSAMD